MRPKFNLIDKVVKCLEQHKEKRLTARDIAEWIFEHYDEMIAVINKVTF